MTEFDKEKAKIDKEVPLTDKPVKELTEEEKKK